MPDTDGRGGPASDDDSVPAFEPHPLIRGGHLQTIVGRYLPGPRVRLPSTYHEIETGDGDRLSVLESFPSGWACGDPAALLIHGLAGCARSPYVARVAARLKELGARVVRMNLRGAGSGFGLARGIYHSGRTEDVRKVSDWFAARAPGSPIALVGFSLGANLALKLAAEAAEEPLAGLDCVLAANPPLDLSACCRQIQRRENRLYDRNFVRLLRREIARLHARFPDLGTVDLSKARSLYEFDDMYTAPRNGFDGAEDYYARCSAGPLLGRIAVPGLVVHAEDDPFIPPGPFRSFQFPPQLALELIPYGGHLGYLSRTRWRGDRRWLDHRLAAWLGARWEVSGRPRPVAPNPRAAARDIQGGHTAHARHSVQ
jgi:predicted alpha/beta-fold hydrolase